MIHLLKLAHNAPFHYPAYKDHLTWMTSLVPWRAYGLTSSQCRKLVQKLEYLEVSSGTIGQMLNVAKSTIVMTWLPKKDPDRGQLFEPDLKNMEHIAAASAATQNILIGATSLGLRSYWSSGWILKENEQRQLLGIPQGEIFLGVVFIFPDKVEGVQTMFGKLAKKRGTIKDWATFVEL